MSRNTHFLQELPPPKDFFLTTSPQISSWRSTVCDIISGKNPSKLLVIGPCSIHSYDGALEYAEKLQSLTPEIDDIFFPVMRVNLEKPRTRLGWEGFLFDHSRPVAESIRQGRKLYREITAMGIPIATELLHPLFVPYFSDYITWGMIGARTVSSPMHRHLASNAPFTVGFKNSISGDVSLAIDSIIAARTHHTCITIDNNGSPVAQRSHGNPHTHLILRGSPSTPNYSSHDIARIHAMLQKEQLSASIMVDCSHGNCQGDFTKQKDVFHYSLQQQLHSPTPLIGIMLESYLQPGHHLPPTTTTSITDPCLGWEETASLLAESAAFERKCRS